MTTIQARVPEPLADAARERAGELSVSVSQYLADLVRRDVERAAEEAFWSAFPTDAEGVAETQERSEFYAGALKDGLEPEDWSELR